MLNFNHRFAAIELDNIPDNILDHQISNAEGGVKVLPRPTGNKGYAIGDRQTMFAYQLILIS